jgi:butyrate kinase
MLSELQQKFVELDLKKAEYKKFLEEYKQAVNDLAKEVGVGGHFQDLEGTVYQLDECLGKFQYFDRYEVKRTKRVDESRGSLSVTKAKELGYDL